jgi:hypothetical protein
MGGKQHALLPHLQRIRSNLTLGSSGAIKYAAAAGLGLSCLSHYEGVQSDP